MAMPQACRSLVYANPKSSNVQNWQCDNARVRVGGVENLRSAVAIRGSKSDSVTPLR